MALQTRTQNTIAANIETRTAFKAGNVRADWYPTAADVPTGRMPSDHVSAMLTASKSRPVYVVFSYGTPIAYYANALAADTGNGWVESGVRYSVTTTNHQNVVSWAIRTAH